MKIKTNLALGSVLTEAEGLKYWVDDSGAEMTVTQSGGLEIAMGCPNIHKAICEIATLSHLDPLHIMINRLSAQTTVPIHRDYLKPSPLQGDRPCLERWHLPLITNSGSYWWDETNVDNVYMPTGFWYGPMPYWKSHYVANLGQTERIHLIVDLDCPNRLGSY